MGDREAVHPFKPVTWSDIRLHQETDLVTGFALFFPSMDGDINAPDMRIHPDNCEQGRRIMQILRVSYSSLSKEPKSDLAAPSSYVVMCKVSDTMWCVLILIITPVKTALAASVNLMKLRCPTTKVPAASLPSFMHPGLPNDFLLTLRNAINAVCTPVISGSGYMPTQVHAYTNLSITNVGLISGSRVYNVTAQQIMQLCHDTSLINPYVALNCDVLVKVLLRVGELNPSMQGALTQLASWVSLENEPHLPTPPTLIAMTIPHIIDMLTGNTCAPICVSRHFIDGTLVGMGCDATLLAAQPRASLLDAMMRRSVCNYGAGNTPITCRFPTPVYELAVDTNTKYPVWMYKMPYMVTFARDATADWAQFETAFTRMIKRVNEDTLETPPWMVATFRGITAMDAIPLLTDNPSDLIARAPNEWWWHYGDRSGLCDIFTLMENMCTGAFEWAKKPPIMMCINLYSRAGYGKTVTQDFYRLIPGMMMIKSIQEGSALSWYSESGEQNPNDKFILLFMDDSKVGLKKADSKGAPITEGICSLWKDVAGSKLPNAVQAGRGAKRMKASGGWETQTQERRPIPGMMLTSNSQVFNGDTESERAVASRFTFLSLPEFVRMESVNVIREQDRPQFLTYIQMELNWMKVIGLVHASLGISLTNLAAKTIFADTARLVLAQSNGNININSNGRFYEKYVRYVDYYGVRSFVSRLIAHGTPAPLTPQHIAAIVGHSCHVRASPENCIQAVMLLLAGLPSAVPTAKSKSQLAIQYLILMWDTLHFRDDVIVCPRTYNQIGEFFNSLIASNHVECVQTHFHISKAFLKLGVLAASGVPNSLDAALSHIITRANHTQDLGLVTVSAILKMVENPLQLTPVLQLLMLYHVVAPAHVAMSAVTKAAISAAIATPVRIQEMVYSGELHPITFTDFAAKFDLIGPSVTPVADELCRIYHLRRPFFFRTAEGMVGCIRGKSLPGMYHYTPPPHPVYAPVILSISIPGIDTRTVTFTQPDWQQELIGASNGIGDIVHHKQYPFLPTNYIAVVPSYETLAQQASLLSPYSPIPAQIVGGRYTPDITSDDYIQTLFHPIN